VGANQFRVEIVKGDDLTLLDWCYTDPNGYYSCGPVTNPGSAGIRAYLRSSMTYTPYDQTVQVTSPPCGATISCSYIIYTDFYELEDGIRDIGTWYVPNEHTMEGAFWLKDDLDRAYKFVWFSTGISQNPQETSGPATILWSNDSTDGTYYKLGGEIHLKGTDKLSHDTSIHEYGHNVMYTLYQSFPTRDCPLVQAVTLLSGPKCAWTEGWATFFPLAVNNDPVYDTSTGSINLETPNSGTPGWDDGDWVIGRVTGALWDIYDSTNDGSDRFTDGFTNIWDTIFHQNDNTFLQYWTAWRARGHNQANAVQSVYQNTIDYRPLRNPSFEKDDNNNGLPDYWSVNPMFTRSNAIPAKHGSYVGRFHATDNANGVVTQVVGGIVAGEVYEFSDRVNIPATSDMFTFKILIVWRRADNTVISTSPIQYYSAGNVGWHADKASIVAPQGTTNAVVKMVVTNLNATLYVDKFSFIQK
jgi:hypothetical protein